MPRSRPVALTIPISYRRSDPLLYLLKRPCLARNNRPRVSSGMSYTRYPDFPSISPVMRLTTEATGIHALVDYPNSMAPMRGYTPSNTQQITPAENNDPRLREYMSASSPEDNNLDPFSALLKAGEIVDRRNRPPP